MGDPPRCLATLWWYEQLLCMEDVDPDALAAMGQRAKQQVDAAGVPLPAPVMLRLYLRWLSPALAGATRVTADSGDEVLSILGYIATTVHRHTRDFAPSVDARRLLPSADLVVGAAARCLALRVAYEVARSKALPTSARVGELLARLLAEANLESIAAGKAMQDRWGVAGNGRQGEGVEDDQRRPPGGCAGTRPQHAFTRQPPLATCFSKMPNRKARVLRELSHTPSGSKGLTADAAGSLAARLRGLFDPKQLQAQLDAYATAAWAAQGPTYLEVGRRWFPFVPPQPECSCGALDSGLLAGLRLIPT